jgi:simple sugar transport system permease protein
MTPDTMNEPARQGLLSRMRLRAPALDGQLPLLLATVTFFVLFSIAAPNVFPTLLNLQAMAFQFPEVGLLALGVLITMIAAGIDLSVVAIAVLSGLTAAQFLHFAGTAGGGPDSWPMTVLAVLIALAVGTLCGALNGLIIGRLGITPILATLATSGMFTGVALVWTGGVSVVGLPESFLSLGRPVAFGIPAPLIIFAIGAIAAGVFLNRTRLGLTVALVGANLSAARHSGLRPVRVLLATYAVSGFMAAMAGIVIVARTSSASPAYGQSYVLLAIIIAVLGGVDLAGGFGSVAGVALAAICLATVQAGFATLGLDQFLYQVAQGLILVGVMAIRAPGSAQARVWLAQLFSHGPTDGAPDSPATGGSQPSGAA